MKVFLTSLVAILILVFGLNYYVDPFGLRNIPTEKLIGENPENCAIDSRLIPEGAQVRFREGLALKNHPQIVAIGSSRVGEIHQDSFPNQTFINFTLPDFGPDAYLRLADFFENQPDLKMVYLGIEFYAFGNQSLFFKLVDRVLKASERLGVKDFTKKSFLRFYKFRGSPLFPNLITRYVNILTEYLSIPATKRTLRFLTAAKIEEERYHVKLPPNSPIESKCLISLTPEIGKNQVWDAQNGSNYSYEEMMGLKRVSDFSEYDPKYFDGADPASHWHLFTKFSDISDAKIYVLERMLNEFSKRNIKVVGFTSPFPDKIVRLWKERGFESLQRKFDMKLSKVFARYDDKFVPAPLSSSIRCNDDTDYIDVWHPGLECVLKALEYVKAKAGENRAL
jgi:hypothetical protein